MSTPKVEILFFRHFAQIQEGFFMSFIDNLYKICNEKGTSPTRVCIEIGVSTNKVSAWKKGSMPKADLLLKIAQHLEVHVMDFFDDSDFLIGDLPVPKVEFALDEDETEIIKLFRRLSRKDKHEFMARVYWYEDKLDKEEQQ